MADGTKYVGTEIIKKYLIKKDAHTILMHSVKRQQILSRKHLKKLYKELKVLRAKIDFHFLDVLIS